jgi:hypothetical protein
MSYDRRWLEEEGSEDSHARALWAVGTVLGRSRNEGYGRLCGLLFKRGLPVVQTAIQRGSPGERYARLAFVSLGGLALVRAGGYLWQCATVDATRRGARDRPQVFALALQHPDGASRAFPAIGSNGFNVRGGHRSEFDQQPIEALATRSACLEAYRATKDSAWSVEAQRAFEWFLGRNDLGLPLYDSATGGGRDGLHHDRTNEKQGAESSLAFYLARAEMTLAQNLMEAQTPIVT